SERGEMGVMAAPSRLLSMNPAGRRPNAPVKPPTTVRELVDLTNDLPPLPSVALATHRETNKPTATAKSVSALVSSDPALTARILRLSNSAFYGGGGQISSVNGAVLMLGMQGVRNLCLLAGTYSWLQGGLPAYGLEPGALLTHSLAAAVACKAIAERTETDEEAAFTAGLLHDLGKVGLAMWIRAEHGSVESWRQERKAVGFDHAQVGGELVRRWNLPLPLVGAITCHHMPCQGLEDVLYVGDLIAHLMEGHEVDVEFPEALERCGVSPEELSALAEGLMPEFERFKGLAGACP
ncbi:HDOD domain-containing protein, partial [bacterium]